MILLTPSNWSLPPGLPTTLVASLAAASTILDRMEQPGQRFYRAGSEIVSTLNQLSRALSFKDKSRIGEFYSPRFRGEPLGLTSLRLAEEKDGVR